MKANKVIRHLVEESIAQTENANTLLRRSEELAEIKDGRHQFEIDTKNRRIGTLEAEIRELRDVKFKARVFEQRLREAGLDTSFNESDAALEALRQKLTGE